MWCAQIVPVKVKSYQIFPNETKNARKICIDYKLLKIGKMREHHIFYNDEMDLFFDGKQMPLEPVEEWLRTRIEKIRKRHS